MPTGRIRNTMHVIEGNMSDQVSSNLKPGPDRYSTVAIWLHWMIAVLIIFNLSVGFFMEDFPPPLRFIVIGAHISAGITVLILTVCRIIWRSCIALPHCRRR